jgi:WD40 repeat protein
VHIYPKIVHIVILFILCLVLSACTGLATVSSFTKTYQIQATISTVKVTHPNLTPNLQQSPTFTISLQTSRTPTPSPRPYNTTATRTQINTVVVDHNATLTRQANERAFELTATQIASFPVTCDHINQFYTLQSPGGNWLAVNCGDNSNRGLEVLSKEGKRWILQYKDFLAKDLISNGEPGPGGLYPEHWTIDERYLYFTARLGISGGGPCFYGWNTDGLYRINVEDGTVTTTLNAIPSSGAFYDIAFSPDGRYFAYEYYYDHLAIVDLKTGETSTIESGENEVGNLTWSPDGSQLAYGICHDTQDHTATAKSSIRVYSVETHTSRTILDVEHTLLRIESQNGNQVLEIANYDLQGNNKTEYLSFDWSSEQLSTATPSP